MQYKVEFVIDIDDDKVGTEKELKNMMEDLVECASITIRNFKLLEILE